MVPLTPFLWSALAAASAGEMASALGRQFSELAVGYGANCSLNEPVWATPNQISLELPSMRLRRFAGSREGTPTLVCAPLALHDATLTDFAPGHSLIEALQVSGLGNVFVTDWRSASPEIRLYAIDNYLAELNVVVDELGGYANLVGLCQGGWMALSYAARYPTKVRALVVTGTPVDIQAGASELSQIAQKVPLSTFKRLVEIGDGRIRGTHLLQLWKNPPLDSEVIHRLLQIREDIASEDSRRLIALFREWYGRPIDLPGIFYLQVVNWLYKENQLARGRFIGLGRDIDLSRVTVPIFLLGARDDEIVAPEQLLAVRRLVGTQRNQIRQAMIACSHLGLFMGARTVRSVWPKIARWLTS
jgi:poly(3-hydroxybutyrate) depolymerase